MAADSDPARENLTALEKWAYVMGFTEDDLLGLIRRGIKYPSQEAAYLIADTTKVHHAC